jgi:serine/threonine protein phosphatase PrpC
MRADAFTLQNRLGHELQDGYYVSSLSMATENKYNLFLIADGCSGYNGAVASRKAITNVSQKVESHILATSNYSKDVLKQAIIEANADLVSWGDMRTTLDVVMVTPSKIDVAHLGDSRVYFVSKTGVRQVTKDETLGSAGPANYLGETIIIDEETHEERRIEDRINIESYTARPQRILMATDGLISRVPDSYINKILMESLGYTNPENLFKQLGEQVLLPREMLKVFDQGRLDKKLLSFLPRQNYFRVDEKISAIIQLYEQQSNPKFVEAFDHLLSFDDTTLLFIDFEDSLGKSLAQLQEWQVSMPEIQKDLVEITREKETLVLGKSKAEGELEAANASLTSLQTENEANLTRIESLDDTVELYEITVERQEGRIVNLNMEAVELTGCVRTADEHMHGIVDDMIHLKEAAKNLDVKLLNPIIEKLNSYRVSSTEELAISYLAKLGDLNKDLIATEMEPWYSKIGGRVQSFFDYISSWKNKTTTDQDIDNKDHLGGKDDD